MGTDVINAPELAALVKPVRALLKKSKKIDAIKLVRERTDCGLKESKEFVDHVQALPGMKTRKVAELWTSTEARRIAFLVSGNKEEGDRCAEAINDLQGRM